MKDDEKIEEYKRLYKIHSAKNVSQEDNKDSKPDKSIHRVILVQKKINSVNDALKMQTFKKMNFNNMDDGIKSDLKKSLETTIEEAQSLLDILSPQQMITDKED
jgi:hypothetical protein